MQEPHATLLEETLSRGARAGGRALFYATFAMLVACGRLGFEPVSVTHPSLSGDAGESAEAGDVGDAGLVGADAGEDPSPLTDAASSSVVDAEVDPSADAEVEAGADANADAGVVGSPADSGAPVVPADDAGADVVLPRWRSFALPYASGAAASAVLADGLHYLGGSSHYFGDTRYRHHYVYSASTGSWSAAPADVPDSDTWGARAHVYQGKLYLLGGYPGGNRLRVYDPLTNAWTQLKAPPVDFQWGFASGVIGGALFAFGGEPLAATNADGYKYDFAANAWTKVASIPQNRGRGALSSAVVGSRLYVLNGNQDDGTSILQIYDSATNTWSLGTSLQGHLFEAAAAVAIGSEVHFFGGAANQDLVDSSSAPATLTNRVSIYDTTTDRWAAGTPMQVAKMWATCVEYEGEVHVLGGLDPTSSELADHEVLGP